MSGGGGGTSDEPTGGLALLRPTSDADARLDATLAIQANSRDHNLTETPVTWELKCYSHFRIQEVTCVGIRSLKFAIGIGIDLTQLTRR